MEVDITHLAIKIDFQTSDHVFAMEKVATNIFQQNALYATVFKIEVILLIREGT